MNQSLIVLGRLSRMLDRFGGLIVLPAMTFVMTLDVLLRYVFNAPLIWGLELVQYLLVIVFMTGILECTRTDGNIRMDLIYVRMPPGGKRSVTVLYCVIGAGVFSMLAHKAAVEIPLLWSIPETTEYLHLRMWAYYAMMVAISALMTVYFVLRGVAAAIGATIPDGSAVDDGRENR